MVCLQSIYYDPAHRLLVCKVHGYGVHPSRQSIIRHLRGKGHQCRGEALKLAVTEFSNLDLSSIEDLRDISSITAGRIVAPVSHLRILDGWSCVSCSKSNDQYLTTSLELVQRHAANNHGKRRGDEAAWEAVRLQTFFQETKYRQYFRVDDARASDRSCGGSEAIVGKCQATNAPFQTNERCQKRARFLKRSRIPLSVWRLYGNAFAPTPSLRFHHPYATIARKHVPLLSVTYLDSFFKSGALRSASEPLFDSSHVDADHSMIEVFPDSENEPVFWSALIYSIMQFADQGSHTVDSYMLQKQTIGLLNERLSSASAKVSQPVIGAIMLLKTTAYKFYDYEAHSIHSSGLWTALKHRQDHQLTIGAKRAFFWQDLYASVFVNSQRQTDCTVIPENVNGRRNTLPSPLDPLLPAGFHRYQHDLPKQLLNCVDDILELQSLQKMTTQSSQHTRYHCLDSMQAVVEERLVLQAQICQDLGIVAEATRLAIFICCYCSWMEIWNDSLIPCKLGAALLELLDTSFARPELDQIWLEQVDLLLWILLVGCSVVELDQGHIRNLKQLRRRVVTSSKAVLAQHSVLELEQAFQSATTEFIYCGDWVDQRLCIREWAILESLRTDNEKSKN